MIYWGLYLVWRQEHVQRVQTRHCTGGTYSGSKINVLRKKKVSK